MIDKILGRQIELFESGITRPIKYRLLELEKLKVAITKYEDEIVLALKQDLNKPEFEAYSVEIGRVLDSIEDMTKNLEKWARVKTVKALLQQPFDKSIIKFEPYGSTLIIASYNYPFQHALDPLVGAIAAGNTAVINLSIYTPKTAAIIVKLIAETFDTNYVTVVTGGRQTIEALIHAPFDYIFFTGSTEMGKVVMHAAADNLTPLILKLGGKSPAIVHKDADIQNAARKIAWGKFINAGQTAVSPDYVYVHTEVENRLIDEILKCTIEFYGPLPLKSPDYGRIVDEKHFNEIVSMIDHDKVIIGGQYDLSSKFIAPTVMREVTWNDAVMKSEIFGPLLPILVYDSIEDIIDKINQNSKASGLYVFSESESVQEYLLDQISFGEGCINDVIIHSEVHGFESFKTFSHQKSILKKSTIFDFKRIYPPYNTHLKVLRNLLKKIK